jgi:hypothetical protein
LGETETDDVIYLGETGPSASGDVARPYAQMHFFEKIISHRIRGADSKYIEKNLIKSGDEGRFEFLTRFTTGETMWLTELCFADIRNEYCTVFVEYCEIYGILYV